MDAKSSDDHWYVYDRIAEPPFDGMVQLMSMLVSVFPVVDRTGALGTVAETGVTAVTARSASTLPYPYDVFGTEPVGHDGEVAVVHAVVNKADFICAGVSDGFAFSIRAITPDT